MKNKYFNPKGLAYKLKQAIKPGLYALSATALLTVGYMGGTYNGVNKTKAECLSHLKETTHDVKLANSMAESELKYALRYNGGWPDRRKHTLETSVWEAKEKQLLTRDALRQVYDLEKKIKNIK